ncbi:xanthine dehydrogenase molybdopterin binding subunit [Pigmentiphaga sp. GD03639]|uniref:xanthine dehydrogenase molybdopterin binding subunit n=1 Tax=unclassified Pigmentiphaga TaxID=2626614 RepID=UPI000B413DD3|nr:MULTISPECIES: xanthine dehydrogenase molybdopterin binding subunit [unclassified Pigmentiphaga]MDH2235919.1 xanthine dehydrogenase molybdopterin binding subunit [Pigmentiphaga sp. GD03639]OVZ60924.1 xanthine dehydrogenase molybdopterin binding subunit [Pigmentiphaga sp. NML030171]
MNAPDHPGILNIEAEPQACGVAAPHEAAHLHVSGRALYVDDVPEPRGTLFVAPVLSKVAHGRLMNVDASAALAMPGVRRVVTAADLPAANVVGAGHDEPILPADLIEYLGQPVALVIATGAKAARVAARAVRMEVEPLPAILTIAQALEAESWVLPPVHLVEGDVEAAMAAAPHRLHGEFAVGGQEQFYLEGQIALAMPGEDGTMKVLSSTQHPGEVQHWVADALGVPAHSVQVECRRMGGGFGGKETQAGHIAVWAAVAARIAGAPCKMRLDRDDDFLITGKRHPFLGRWTVGFDGQGRVLAIDLTQAAACGFSADLSGPIADRAIFHADNAYYLPAAAIHSYRCKTHTQSHTAFRGFGGPQGVGMIEAALDDIARHLGLDPLAVRRINLYGDAPRDRTPYGMRVTDNILPELIERLAADCGYARRREAIARWNAASPVIKRGLALTPVKFGISFTATMFNQAGALVNVYTDGSVTVNHGGTEMGQGLHTKVCQVVADTLGVPLAWVRITATDTGRVPNASATAASSGTDLNGRAAEFAAREVRDRLRAHVAGTRGLDVGQVSIRGGKVLVPGAELDFAAVAKAAYAARVSLWSDGYYATPKIHYDHKTMRGRPFYYFAYGAAATEVAVDTLTGETRVLRVDILHDVGRSINPAIDLGQIEGGFVQGVGWLTSEELVWKPDGALATHAPSTYKIPTSGDVPADFHVELWPEPNREDNVYGSKAVGEPPFMLGFAAFFAIRDAVAAARREQGRGPLVPLSAPATPEAVLRAVEQ